MTAEQMAWAATEFIRCKPWLEAALGKGIPTHSIDDVWSEIESGNAQIWPASDAVMVTIVHQYPKLKVVRSWLAGGKLQQIIDLEPTIRDWAKRAGCQCAIVEARNGWKHMLPSYMPKATLLVRYL